MEVATPPVEEPEEMPLPSDPTVIFLGGLFALALLAALYVAAEIVLPFVLAVVLKLLLQPAMRLLAMARTTDTRSPAAGEWPAFADHRRCKTGAQLRQIGPYLDPFVQPRRVQLFLHRRHRHDALVGIAQMMASFFGLYGPRLEHENAGDDLKAVGDAVLHLLEQNLLLLKQVVLFALGLTAPRHVLYRQKYGGSRTIFIKHAPCIEQHHAPADRWEFVLDLKGLDGAALWNDVFEDLAEPWNVPLPVAQLEEQAAFSFPWRYRERPVERAARGNHAQLRVEHQKGLPYGIDDGLGQVMPMRDGGERIAFGHSQSSVTAAKILSDLMADQNSAAGMRLHRTQ